ARFLDRDAALDSAFAPSARAGHYLADLYALARAILHRAGVARVSGGDRCTYSEADHFFSFRRQARCGRMASLIWLQD
ncbi:laccase domain-containing protein, partial [Hydrocarboniphaga effusa]